MGLKPITLTSREYDVLIRLTKRNLDIADELGTTIGLVNKQYYKLSGKLDASSRAEMIVKALRLGLVDLWDFII